MSYDWNGARARRIRRGKWAAMLSAFAAAALCFTTFSAWAGF